MTDPRHHSRPGHNDLARSHTEVSQSRLDITIDVDELAQEVWEDEAPSAGLTESAAPILHPPSEHALPTVEFALPVGIHATGWRVDHDTLGHVRVPADRYWGPQTQRSLEHFAIGTQRMPIEVIRAYGHIKHAAAHANMRAGVLTGIKAAAITHVCREITGGLLDDHFPLVIYQTGSGTHTNANVNEVIANRGNQLLGNAIGSNTPLHPNDDVNMSQSSNDTFVTAMHVAAYTCLTSQTLPALHTLAAAIDDKARAWADVVKIGRTHLMDATPITVGQEWSGYHASLTQATDALRHASSGLLAVALGGTAVGTGLNAPATFRDDALERLAELTGHPFHAPANPFAAQSTLDALVRVHGAMKGVAVALFKIGNDLRWLGSGPRSGLQELRLPANEPGSTMMPGKVNPTQIEALLQVCLQVMGLDVAVSMAGAEGNFELNAFRPMVIANVLTSAHLLADTAASVARFHIAGATLNRSHLAANVDNSLMLVTALVPQIGYEHAATIAHDAVALGISLREAAARHGLRSAEFDDLVHAAVTLQR